jgi:hypothetical protein
MTTRHHHPSKILLLDVGLWHGSASPESLQIYPRQINCLKYQIQPLCLANKKLEKKLKAYNRIKIKGRGQYGPRWWHYLGSDNARLRYTT